MKQSTYKFGELLKALVVRTQEIKKELLKEASELGTQEFCAKYEVTPDHLKAGIHVVCTDIAARKARNEN